MISLVVAVAQNGIIGNNGKIPWRIADDMRHFKAVTLGKPCIMGRKTWESLPKKPLPGRTNIVVTRDASFEAPGAVIVHSLEEAFARAEAQQAPEIAVIGGADIYAAALSRATRIISPKCIAPLRAMRISRPLIAPSGAKPHAKTARPKTACATASSRWSAGNPFTFLRSQAPAPPLTGGARSNSIAMRWPVPSKRRSPRGCQEGWSRIRPVCGQIVST